MSESIGGPTSPFYDSRHSFPLAQRAEITTRQHHHLCADCGPSLVDAQWEGHPAVREAGGGRTQTWNGIAHPGVAE
jgi:hypothetical protein